MAPRRASIGGSRGRGRTPSPSPLGRNTRAPIHPSGSSTLPMPITVEVDDDSPSTKKRCWTSPVWKHYNIKEGKHISDGKDHAYCKYYNGGPVDADSSNGTSNFRRHTESCSARSSTNVGQMMIAKDGKLARKFSQFEYKELVAQAIIGHGYTFTFAEHEGTRTIYVYLNEDCLLISWNTAKSHCVKIHKREKHRVMQSLSPLISRICVTFDLWTSCMGHGFLSLTAHYTDANWHLF
ncbi:hypothetical protein Cgig2_029605 [Carnegiea gigantea]|uniref:Uncharacterized protein n=1 Tax=Carnegiea gigantea TaxID=171969 RepID=A0A9Q1K3M8_9CARY|nr:hypothetical protein Cgig2_029605 [Carnegiea gigantea]